jgi:coenzyme Q-binding protein COQ10
MAQASLTKVLDVSKDKLVATIGRYEDYPQFVTGCQKVEVDRKSATEASVKYSVSMMGKNLWYSLDHVENAEAGTLTWKMTGSDLLKTNTGSWKLKDLGDGKTEVTYTIDIEFKIWIPGPVLKTLTATSLPLLISEYEKRAKASA